MTPMTPTTHMTPRIAVAGLRVRRGGREVLALDALEVAPGESLAVLGPNGAGKSTLLLAAALLLPAAGSVAYDGVLARRRDAVRMRRTTSTVFQDAALLDVSAQQNVEEALAIRGVPREERRRRASAWLERLGVNHRASARPHQLSGGEAQRVSIARALAVEPRVLFLDEPFSGLDAATRGRLVGEVRTLLTETGVTALLATHDYAEAALLSQRVLVLEGGRPLAHGPTAEVLTSPPSAQVAGMLGFTIVDADALAPFEVTPGGSVAGLPPGAVSVAPDGASMRGSVAAVEATAGGVRLRVALPAGAVLAADVSLAEFHARGWSAGDEVTVALNPARIVWW
jgi:tungstate transport system ATP-binding protein